MNTPVCLCSLRTPLPTALFTSRGPSNGWQCKPHPSLAVFLVFLQHSVHHTLPSLYFCNTLCTTLFPRCIFATLCAMLATTPHALASITTGIPFRRVTVSTDTEWRIPSSFFASALPFSLSSTECGGFRCPKPLPARASLLPL